jgi:hypothetical protein
LDGLSKIRVGAPMKTKTDSYKKTRWQALMMVAGLALILAPLSIAFATTTATQHLKFSDANEIALKYKDGIRYGRPSGNTVSSSTCRTIQVISSATLQDRRVEKIGHGSLFAVTSRPEFIYVLTAAHVLRSADSYRINCVGSAHRARLVGMDESVDIGLLEVATHQRLEPLFELNSTRIQDGKDIARDAYLNLSENYLILPDGLTPEPGKLYRQTQEGAHALDSWVKVDSLTPLAVDDSPLLGEASPLLLRNFAVPKGVSGSPIVQLPRVGDSLFDRPALVGMVVMTKLNDRGSIVIPAQVIEKTLLRLIKGSSEKNSPAGAQRFAFRTTLSLTGDQVSEARELLLPSADRSDGLLSLQSSCLPRLQTVNLWTPVLGKGDHGETGEENLSGQQQSETFQFRGKPVYGDGIMTARSHCGSTGVIDGDGHHYIALRTESGDLLGLESIEDLYPFVRRYGADFPHFLQKNGIQRQNSREFFKNACERSLRRQESDLEPRAIEHSFLAIQNSSRIQVDHGVSLNEAGDGEDRVSSNSYSCNPKTGLIKIESAFNFVALALQITESSLTGKLRIGRCQATLTDRKTSPFRTQYKDANLEFELKVDPSTESVAIDFFKIASACGLPQELENSWLWKLSVKIVHPAVCPDGYRDDRHLSLFARDVNIQYKNGKKRICYRP